MARGGAAPPQLEKPKGPPVPIIGETKPGAKAQQLISIVSPHGTQQSPCRLSQISRSSATPEISSWELPWSRTTSSSKKDLRLILGSCPGLAPPPPPKNT
eukprot:663540-Pelagomonas_calceolata.AAC.2